MNFNTKKPRMTFAMKSNSACALHLALPLSPQRTAGVTGCAPGGFCAAVPGRKAGASTAHRRHTDYSSRFLWKVEEWQLDSEFHQHPPCRTPALSLVRFREGLIICGFLIPAHHLSIIGLTLNRLSANSRMLPHFVLTGRCRFQLHLWRLYCTSRFQETETQYSRDYSGGSQ